MKDYVYGSKNGISIIDITKTIYQIADACNFLQRTVVNGGKILFVGTKRQAQQIVREAAENTGMFYMMERWMPSNPGFQPMSWWPCLKCQGLQ